MIVPDVNVLIYAADDTSRHHDVAREWWERVLSSDTPVGLPWVVSSGFMRIVSNPRIVERPWSALEALDVVDGWLERPNVLTIGPGRRHPAILRELLTALGRGAELIPDAHIAAIAIEHDAALWSSDRGFARFPGLIWNDPLAERL